jgi:hypothetical protein
MGFPEELDQVSSPPYRDRSVSVAPNYPAGERSIVVEIIVTVRKRRDRDTT